MGMRKNMRVKELKELLQKKWITDDMEVIPRSDMGAPPVTEPDFYVTATEEDGTCLEIMPGRKIG